MATPNWKERYQSWRQFLQKSKRTFWFATAKLYRIKLRDIYAKVGTIRNIWDLNRIPPEWTETVIFLIHKKVTNCSVRIAEVCFVRCTIDGDQPFTIKQELKKEVVRAFWKPGAYTGVRSFTSANRLYNKNCVIAWYEAWMLSQASEKILGVMKKYLLARGQRGVDEDRWRIKYNHELQVIFDESQVTTTSPVASIRSIVLLYSIRRWPEVRR